MTFYLVSTGLQDHRVAVITYYQVTAGAFAPLVFCDDLSEIDLSKIWHSYVVYPHGQRQ